MQVEPRLVCALNVEFHSQVRAEGKAAMSWRGKKKGEAREQKRRQRRWRLYVCVNEAAEKKTGRKKRRGTFNGPAVVFVSTL